MLFEVISQKGKVKIALPTPLLRMWNGEKNINRVNIPFLEIVLKKQILGNILKLFLCSWLI